MTFNGTKLCFFPKVVNNSNQHVFSISSSFQTHSSGSIKACSLKRNSIFYYWLTVLVVRLSEAVHALYTVGIQTFVYIQKQIHGV